MFRPLVRALPLLLLLAAGVMPRSTGAAAPPPHARIPNVSFGLFDPIPSRELARLHTRFVRVTAKWDTLEPTEGGFDWSTLDAQILPRLRAGRHVVIAINSDSAWGSWCGIPDRFSAPKPSKQNAFGAFIRALAERYDGDGVGDAAPIVQRIPVHHYEVENQWVTAVFYRGSDNCGAAGFGRDDLAQIGLPLAGETPGKRRPTPEDTGNPAIAAHQFAIEYGIVYRGARLADRAAVVGPGNIPTQTADAYLFCEGRLGRYFAINAVRADGSIGRVYRYSRADVCDAGGSNTNHIKNWVRYWNVVLQRAMPVLAGRVDFIDLAQYGLYSLVDDRNEWAVRMFRRWPYPTVPALVSWEMAGIDLRVTAPSSNPHEDVALDLVKRMALGFATGARSQTWFHYYFNPGAAPAVQGTSLLAPDRTRLPAYFNYRLLTDQVSAAEGATLEMLGPGAPGYLVRFSLPGGHEVAIAWADGGLDAAIPVTSTSVSVIEATGDERMHGVHRAAPGGLLHIHLGPVPVFIDE